jgi:LPXTG-site transpeptidase (sortase) family protein
MEKIIKRKHLFTLVFVAVFLAFVWGVATYFQILPKHEQDIITNVFPDKAFGWKFPVTKFPDAGPISGIIAYSGIRDIGGIPEGLPIRLKIPSIGVDSAIEDALITPDGRMDVPAGSVNVAWFAFGPHPGEKGSAVIGGHFGIKNGVPFVFYNLDKMKVDDKIYIENDKGDTLTFAVRTIKSFDRNADATTVFTSDDGLAHLNLVTCEGIWNQTNGNYPQRLVVFTDAI